MQLLQAPDRDLATVISRWLRKTLAQLIVLGQGLPEVTSPKLTWEQTSGTEQKSRRIGKGVRLERGHRVLPCLGLSGARQ